MAVIADVKSAEFSLGQKLHNLWTALVERMQRRRVYRTTVAQLSQMSSRELNDLGISRGSIRNIAFEAAYGK